MWRTKDYEDIGRHLRRLRGIIPSGNLFSIEQYGSVKLVTACRRADTPFSAERSRSRTGPARSHLFS